MMKAQYIRAIVASGIAPEEGLFLILQGLTPQATSFPILTLPAVTAAPFASLRQLRLRGVDLTSVGGRRPPPGIFAVRHIGSILSALPLRDAPTKKTYFHQRLQQQLKETGDKP